MKATVIIKRKVTKDIETKYGTKTLYSLLLTMGSKEAWASCFSAPISDAWKEGDKVIDMELVKNGKFWNIVVPKGPEKASQLTEILDTLKRMETKIDAITGNVKASDDPEFDAIPDATQELPKEEDPFAGTTSDEETPF